MCSIQRIFSVISQYNRRKNIFFFCSLLNSAYKYVIQHVPMNETFYIIFLMKHNNRKLFLSILIIFITINHSNIYSN